ncbi:hypothetical protein Pmar_PMAR015936 [Perkinsus marinus ATCC 50983]|uniref:Uncharacterized protein n=1 Tax=Perkinsus marinus (strain ATCC 50983 / TXsc) TaxID=423536 RepID=C5L451_PERM5|nr:hypothetical protein Pmar_PMAR015936 [Perkinsus marinus ATCC 50983]EER08517.1 hypothetical protein Pmar_PMAR015936 [Perkinsus marinus ATCC 50983]|eukprot:XP_002776701.1 hypothetical protein Pmar_PMAR015936 [Perkinsus marinus ATCC 50983]
MMILSSEDVINLLAKFNHTLVLPEEKAPEVSLIPESFCATNIDQLAYFM